jgi:hypothetical protein
MANPKTSKINTLAAKVSMTCEQKIQAFGAATGRQEVVLDNGFGGISMKVSPPIRFRIEWADSQGIVTASWLAAHFISSRRFIGLGSPDFWRGF